MAVLVVDPIGDALGEFPVVEPVSDEDARLAVRAVVVHAAEEWPAGTICRNDRAPHPCRLARWGWRVLLAAEVPAERIGELADKGDPDASPWA
ncbi:hypothetical protein [Micromonospora sp. NPDC049679]|uniref:hypothetical protein n=1 Tax=Micromonospora sp. NPDC049679 TaxID=3155920 RepID=UPI003405139D